MVYTLSIARYVRFCTAGKRLVPNPPLATGNSVHLKKPRNASLVSHTLPLHVPALHSPHYGPELRQLLPTCSDEYTDSGNLDAVANLLYQGSDRTLSETVMMMIPEAWQDNKNLTEAKK